MPGSLLRPPESAQYVFVRSQILNQAKGKVLTFDDLMKNLANDIPSMEDNMNGHTGPLSFAQMKSRIKSVAGHLLASLLIVLPLTACSEKTMNLDVAIYNYWPRAIYDVTVNGQYAGGAYMAYHPGGAGGSAVCCVKVEPGPVTVEYSLGGSEGSSRLAERIHATAVLQELPGASKVLTVHLYPDETTFVEVSKEYVDERPEPQNVK